MANFVVYIEDVAALPIYDIFSENLSTNPVYTENHRKKDTYEVYTTSVSSFPIDNIDSKNPTTVQLQSESHPYEKSTEYLSTLSTLSADFKNEEITIPTDDIYYTQEESTERASTVSEHTTEFENEKTTESTDEIYYTQEESTEPTSAVSEQHTEAENEETTDNGLFIVTESTEPASTVTEQSAEFENKGTTESTDKLYYALEDSIEPSSTISEQNTEFEKEETAESTDEMYYPQQESTDPVSIVSEQSVKFANEEVTELIDEMYYGQEEFAESASTVSEQSTEFENEETTVPIHEEKNAITDFEQMIKIDNEAIVQQFNPFISISFQPVFKEHQQRAKAFLTCCQWDIGSDELLLKKYVDAYGLLDEQMKIIKECADKMIIHDKSDCEFNLRLLEKARQLTKVFIDLYSENNTINDNSAMKLLDQAIVQSIDVKNIVYDYDTTTNDFCGFALILLWQPYKLINCEIYYRSLLSNNLLFYNNYNKFKKEISPPFQQKALSLMIPVKNAWNIIVDQVKKNIQTKLDNKPLSQDQIDKDTEQIKNRLSYYIIKLNHPMIIHHTKSAHTYKVCCTSIKTSDIFNEYLAYFDHDPNQGHSMDKFLHSCVQHQTSEPIDIMTENNECNISYNEFLDAMKKRQDFINKYEKQNPSMVIKFQEAIRFKISQIDIIRTMADYVDQYCQDQHIFELMFDARKIINCEKIIRHVIGKENSKKYSYYNISISYPFQYMVLEDWDNLAQAITSIKTDDDTKPASIVHNLSNLYR
ncbi:unnamed protein product [Rotaria sordida]|uniref:Uncharacterized protein n=1 Tax=Rotaria sordida TaxID=392033 RepID=A0A814AHM0_9BILA|nr:unnamed protein product [Rotaria sordida]CAF3577138.1 unnamed protein product [Rotaria sordida]